MHVRVAALDRALSCIDTWRDTVSVDDSRDMCEDNVGDLYSVNALARAGVADHIRVHRTALTRPQSEFMRYPRVTRSRPRHAEAE